MDNTEEDPDLERLSRIITNLSFILPLIASIIEIGIWIISNQNLTFGDKFYYFFSIVFSFLFPYFFTTVFIENRNLKTLFKIPYLIISIFFLIILDFFKFNQLSYFIVSSLTILTTNVAATIYAVSSDIKEKVVYIQIASIFGFLMAIFHPFYNIEIWRISLAISAYILIFGVIIYNYIEQRS